MKFYINIRTQYTATLLNLNDPEMFLCIWIVSKSVRSSAWSISVITFVTENGMEITIICFQCFFFNGRPNKHIDAMFSSSLCVFGCILRSAVKKTHFFV